MTPKEFLKTLKSDAGRYLSLAIGMGVLAGFLLIAQAWYLAQTVNAVIFEEAGLGDVKSWLIAMLAIFLLRAILIWLSEQVAFKAAANIKLNLRDRLYAHLQALGPVYLRGERAGDIANSLSDGIEALEAYFARYLPAMSLMAWVPLSIVVFVFPMDWLSGVIMLVTAPLIPLFMILIGMGAEKMNQKQWRQLARMSAHFLDMIRGLTTLKLFNASRREADTVAQMSESYRQDTMKVLRVAFLSSLTLEFFATISIALVAVLIGFRLFWGELMFLPGFFVLLLAPEFYLPLRNMGTHYHARMEAIGAVERMVEILETPVPEKTVASLPVDLEQELTIRLQGLSFAYQANEPALRDFDLTIAPDETIALVGQSGSGKTTLINLLMGFIQPTSGSILVNEQPLSGIDPEQWWRQIAWVPQSPRLFKGSIADNIRLGKADASEADIRLAARQARADEFIDALPDGYATDVGELGSGLSGGQIQRIALARAFVKDARIIILDEATASLDQKNEALVSQAIETISKGRTVIMIAHRLNTVRKADRILVLQNGALIEQGPHDELLARGGAYQTMTQYAGAEV